jgi:hypothetical protein
MINRRTLIQGALLAPACFSTALAQGRRVSLSDFNADWSGATDASGAILEWLAAGHGSGREMYVGPGDYLLDNPVIFQMRRALNIVCDERARFFSSDRISTPLISLRGPRQEPYPSLHWTGGRIDNSRGVFRDNAQTNTCLEPIRVADSIIREVRFGTPFHYRDQRADSGITPQSVVRMQILACEFEGLSGSAIYASGGGRTEHDDDGGDVLIADCRIRRCRQAAAIKRDMRGMRFIRNEVKDGFIGVSTLEASGLGPGTGLSVTSSAFDKVVWSAIIVRGQSGGEIVGNTITDAGIEEDGAPSKFPHAIRVLGSDGSEVARNRIALSRQDRTGKTVGVFLGPTKILGNDYRNGANRVADNEISGYGIGILDRDGDPQSDLEHNGFRGVAQKIRRG